MDNQQLQDNEYYIKKKFYIVYSLSVIIAFLCGSFINDIKQINSICICNNTHI